MGFIKLKYNFYVRYNRTKKNLILFYGYIYINFIVSSSKSLIKVNNNF